MKGLEAAEVMLSYAQANNDIFRIDSTYFRKEYLREETVLRARKGCKLLDIGAQIRSFGAYSLNNEVDYIDDGVPFIRGVNMKEGRVSFADMLYISERAHRLLWKSEVKEGMVLLSMSGTIGDVAIATSTWPYPINSNQDIAKIETGGGLNPFCLYAFLLSRFGQNYLKREARGSVQQHVFLSQIEQIEVPVFGPDLEKAVQRAIESSEKLQLAAETSLSRAETTLLHSLDLDAWHPPEALTYVRSSSDAFALERLDAQFFSPRVEGLLKRLGRDGLRIADVAPARHERFTAGGAGTFDYIEIGGLGTDGTASSVPLAQSEAPSRATQYVHAGDVITSTVRPIRRLSALVASEQDGHVCSSGFVVLEPRDVSGEVLLTYLRLPVVCELMDLYTSATMYPAISESDLLNLPIPRISMATQRSIEALVQSALKSRRLAKEMLDAVKCAVEAAIEHGEDAALSYMRVSL